MSRAEDLQQATELESFYKTNAGKEVVKEMRKDVNAIMDRFVGLLNAPDLNKYVALSCELKERLEMIRRLTRAGDLRKVIEESPEIE